MNSVIVLAVDTTSLGPIPIFVCQEGQRDNVTKAILRTGAHGEEDESQQNVYASKINV